VVCTARFDSLFISQELLNPGVQGVIADLFSSRGGQQIYFTPASKSETFRELSERCRKIGHLALGLSTIGGMKLNVEDDVRVAPGDQVVTIGATRPESI
jgi:voltage-gated potassium channel